MSSSSPSQSSAAATSSQQATTFPRSVDAIIPLPNSSCGASMRSQGFGTWRGDTELVGAAVKKAVLGGYRLIDCARLYRNEAAIGVAIAELTTAGEDGTPPAIDRSELYIVGKIWNTDHRPETVRAAALQSIKDLQCGYLDCLLIHWPVAWVHPQGGDCANQTEFFNLDEATGGSIADTSVTILDTYRAMEALVDEGLVRDIGVSNFTIAELDALLGAGLKHKPVTNQVEVHPALPQEEMKAYCDAKGIVVMAYKPYGIDGTDYAGGLMHNAQLKAIAADASLPSAAHLLLQWSCQRGIVVLCKSTTEARIAANASVPSGGLSAETMGAVANFSATFEGKRRLCNPYNFKPSYGLFFPE